MRKDLLIVALGLFATAGVAVADELAVPETQAKAEEAQAAPQMMLPSKGSTMSDVKKKFGDPRDKKPPVGGDTPKHPPITRWDYDGFVVIFERDRVVDAVVPGSPPKLRSTAGLTPATNAPPPPGAPAAEPIVPETPPAESAPPMEPEAAAAPAEPPPPVDPVPPEQPPAEKMEPAPVVSPPPEQAPSDGPPTPK